MKIEDMADMVILNCWPELITLANNYIISLFSLCTENPALTLHLADTHVTLEQQITEAQS